jgi:hypothetical protein
MGPSSISFALEMKKIEKKGDSPDSPLFLDEDDFRAQDGSALELGCANGLSYLMM